PSSATTVPSSTSKSRLSTATNSPKRFVRPRVSIATSVITSKHTDAERIRQVNSPAILFRRTRDMAESDATIDSKHRSPPDDEELVDVAFGDAVLDRLIADELGEAIA